MLSKTNISYQLLMHPLKKISKSNKSFSQLNSNKISTIPWCQPRWITGYSKMFFYILFEFYIFPFPAMKIYVSKVLTTFWFYYFLSPRIFQIERIWVDQRTFVLSMSQGGWIHSHVMDCFAALSTTAQLEAMKLKKVCSKSVVRHIFCRDITVSTLH
jgi:hypothetical protein